MFNLHFAIIIFGLAGVAGKLLTASSSTVVFARTALAAISLALVWRCSSNRSPVDRNTIFRLLPSGTLLGVHWLTFFLSVKVSTVAIGLLSFATFPVFVAFLSPLLSGSRLVARDVVIAAVVSLGLTLVVPSYSFSDHLFQGVLWGLLSACTFALVTILNKRIVRGTDPIVVGMLQNGWAAVLFLPWSSGAFSMTPLDIALVVFLGLGCSALGHTLFVAALKKVRAELAAVSSGLEPLYGIVFAYLILGEVPSAHALLGGALIIFTVTVASVLDSRQTTQPVGA